MNITPIALIELKKVLASKKDPKVGIRIYSMKGSCGNYLQMDVRVKAKTDDKAISVQSLNFFVDKSTAKILDDLNIDFKSNRFDIIEGEQNSCL